MNKLDFKKQDKVLYSGKAGRFDVLTVPAMSYLMIDGKGNPGTSQAFVDAVSALYPLAYNIKFHSKIKLQQDFVVPPLSGLWWADDMSAFCRDDRDQWQWTMMIRQPDWITTDIVDEMKQQVLAKDTKKKDSELNPDALKQIRFETLDEGLCVQVLHVGPYSEEGPILKQMHEQFIPDNGYAMTGKHHEIYLGDPRKTAPQKLKTILRQPIRKT
tara:strand:- start:1191 stop:1832 length:642 start_codon:yes stop_codon:yes gene_type:complete